MKYFALKCQQCGSVSTKRFRYKEREPKFCSRKCNYASKYIPAEERFWSRVNKTASCWLWTGGTSNGYAAFYIGKPILAHTFSFSLHGKKIPKGYVIDHTCMNRRCVNPNHLRAVTRSINATENSNSTAAMNKRKTRCLNGHEFDQVILTKNGLTVRRCSVCNKNRLINFRARRKLRALSHI